MKNMNRHKGIILVFFTAIISGFSIFINQFGVQVINPYVFTGLKNIAAVGLLVGLILFLREWRQIKVLTKRQWLTLILIGLIGGSIPFLLFFKGLSMTNGALASLIHKTMFVYVAAMAVVFLRERINKNLIIGILLLLAGNALLLKITPNVSAGRGDLLVFIATLFWAVEQIISKKAVAAISPRIVALGRMFFGFLFILIFWGFTGQLQFLTNLSLGQMSWVWLTAFILFGYLVTWYTGIKYIPISVATCVLALGAPITAVLELIHGRFLTKPQILGVVLMGLSLILVYKTFIVLSFPRKRESTTPHSGFPLPDRVEDKFRGNDVRYA